MHTWVKRGLQTALVTGGLLMLGTGIASADENVNPDQPPSPVDAGVSVPIDTAHNAIGTPVGQRSLPSVSRDVSTGDVTDALPADSVAPASQQVNPLMQQAQPSVQGLGGQHVFRGNRIKVDLVVPVQICGNAIAAGGNAHENATCSQIVKHSDPILTDGDGQALAGNVVAANGAIPVQVTGNAISALGNAAASSVAGQSGTTGGDIRTGGDAGTVSGTIGAVQLATPLQVANNAVAGGGNANADSASGNEAKSKGSLRTGGDNGTAAGTVAGVPVAVPFQLDGNGVSGIGTASSQSQSTSNATAGTTGAHNIGLFGHPSWVRTTGDPSTLSGNIAQPQVSGPVSVDDNAAGAIGNAGANSTNNSTDSAGGLSSTTGSGSTGAGNIVDAPVALPTSGAGNAVTGIGNAGSQHTTNVSSTAGGDTLTNGDNSTLSGNSANVPPAGAVDVCGDAAGGIGGAGGSCDNNVTSTTGGYNGTTGNGGAGSGNIGQTPVSVPVESFGTAVGGAGNASSTASETKLVHSGGEPNSADDAGTLTSNIVSTPTSVPAQVFGDSASVIGNSSTATDSDTSSIAGDKAQATGRHGTGAGNIVFVPTSAPTQVFGDADGVVGNDGTMTNSQTLSTAGGRALSDGTGGSASGNVVFVPTDAVDQVFGESAAAVGLTNADTTNETVSKSGDDLHTAGDSGALSGNGVLVPLSPTNQVFGDAVAAGSNAAAVASNDSDLAAGGPARTSAVNGAGSGNLLTVPAELDPDAFGDSASVLGNAVAMADNDSIVNNGGDTWTHGDGPLNAYNFNEPLGADIDLTDAELGVLGNAWSITQDNSIVNNGYSTADEDAMALPSNFGQMGLGTSTPDFPDVQAMPAGGGLPGGSPLAPAVPAAGALTTLPTSGLAGGVPALSHPRAQTQAAPAAGLPTLPQVPLVQGGLGKVTQLPVTHSVSAPTSALQGAKALGSNPTGISGVLPVVSGLFPRI